MGLTALDETLRLRLAEGWFRVTGDRNFAAAQGEFHGASEKQKAAVAEFAGLCAEKYGAACQYLPEIGLLVCAGGYGVGWVVAFNKLRQAAQVVAANKAKKADKPAEAAPEKSLNQLRQDPPV